MPSIEKNKLYMLLELEKIRQNTNKIKGVFPFPISFLRFHVLLVKDSYKMGFDLRKKSVEEDWCLYSTQKIHNKHFNNEGMFYFRNIEAFKVLKALGEGIGSIEDVIGSIEGSIDKSIEGGIEGSIEGSIEDVISKHQVYLRSMEDFNKTKECVSDEMNKLIEIENRHKDKNLYLLETLCENTINNN